MVKNVDSQVIKETLHFLKFFSLSSACLFLKIRTTTGIWSFHHPVPKWLSDKECLPSRRRRFDPWVWKISWRRKWQPTPILLPWKFHEQRSIVGYSPWDHKRVVHNLPTKQQHTLQHSKKNIYLIVTQSFISI